ncbi:Rpn family recombination-promoting nuclease/putative transposase [Salmonella enterica]|nr:Rpn family recombination-promoting nuclease/putative transposase [Salmonella enterica]EBD6817881.1 Rpn family recombination-promoting nuclease/putative transposase [Salmonella enterica]EGH2391645.1 Rpn family recombination-promoting nuclease/putative transposase [Salmonella enterica]
MDNEKGHNRPGHDGLFKLFLREPDTARDFLAVHLPADIRAQVRLDTLKLEPGSFVDQKLRELHSDVLYSVETAEGHAGYIYCLVEHQSTADRMMAWRMMRYSMAVMDAHLKKGNDTLPVVVPLLFYQGTVRPYPYSTDWMDCFDAPALAREVYSRPWPLVDVSVMEDSDLQSHRRMALLELVQRDIRHRDAASLLRDVVQLIRLTGQQDLPVHRRIPQATFSKTVRYWHRFETWLAEQLQDITQHCYRKLCRFVANATTEPRLLHEYRGEYGSLRLFVGPQNIDEIDILEFNPEYIVSWVDKVADGVFTPVCFAVNVHYKNGILLECFTWDSEVDNINRLTSSDYGEAMSQAISWVREQFEQPVIDQPVPQQPRLAA